MEPGSGFAKLEEAARFLEARLPARPSTCLVLGSGLGGVVRHMRTLAEIPYGEIPHWPMTSTVGHAGTLSVVEVSGKSLLVLEGRAHLYEGWSALDVVFGVRTAGLLGVKTLILTNAAGAINESYRPGELVLIQDHINLLGQNPLTGTHHPAFGSRHPDMTEAWTPALRIFAKEAATALGWRMTQGVYAAVAGPNYETPAEIRFLRTIGADLVGMSTVLEAIAASQMGMSLLGISCVTNMAAGITPGVLSHEDVLAAGLAVEARVADLLAGFLPRLVS